MANSPELHPAKIVLLSAHYAANADINALRRLSATYPNVLNTILSLRILLSFLPETTEPALYIPYLQDLLQTDRDYSDGGSIETSTVENLTDLEAQKRARRLRLLPLAYPSTEHEVPNDPLTSFLIHRAHKIDAETGLQLYLPELLEPFLDRTQHIRAWMVNTLLPLLRYNYEYYPDADSKFSLEAFEGSGESAGITFLLSRIARKKEEQGKGSGTLARDLRGLIGPWIYGRTRSNRRRSSGAGRRQSTVARLEEARAGDTSSDQSESEQLGNWCKVYQCLMAETGEEFGNVVETIEHWNGPEDVDYAGYDDPHNLEERFRESLTLQYAQTALAVLYTATENSTKTIEGAYRVLVRVAELAHLPSPPDMDVEARSLPAISLPTDFLDGIMSSHLTYDALLAPSNPLSKPSTQSVSFFFAILLSSSILARLGAVFSMATIADLCLFSNEEHQKAELQRTVRNVASGQKRNKQEWRSIRVWLLWLWDWSREHQSSNPEDDGRLRGGLGVFGKVGRAFLETEILRAFLFGSCYDIATETYIKPAIPDRPLPLEKVEKVVIGTAMTFYDNASNGNIKRGGAKRAFDIINTFREYFPESFSLRQTDALLNATHALSFYSLTLQHGVPFQPVNIRVHQDPISLIGKVLEQNPRSYTKVDDLLDIGRNLVVAGLINPPEEGASPESSFGDSKKQTLVAERQIMGMAIEAALAEDDFDTAYSYVLNRLPPLASTPKATTPGGTISQQAAEDDISWRAAYQAGRYRSKKPFGSPRTELRSIEQRMELLTQALILAPQSALSEILASWRRCEEEMNGLLEQESEEEERWDDRGDRRIPGAFSDSFSPVVQRRKEASKGASQEDAPMGLFDVARGAAAALSKSAFPLRSTGASGHERAGSSLSTGGSDASSIAGSEGETRVRKRDMVSNMVTGGLASGIGWVLGAPPSQHS